MPMKIGIQEGRTIWIPAFAGMTVWGLTSLFVDFGTILYFFFPSGA